MIERLLPVLAETGAFSPAADRLSNGAELVDARMAPRTGQAVFKGEEEKVRGETRRALSSIPEKPRPRHAQRRPPAYRATSLA